MIPLVLKTFRPDQAVTDPIGHSQGGPQLRCALPETPCRHDTQHFPGHTAAIVRLIMKTSTFLTTC